MTSLSYSFLASYLSNIPVDPYLRGGPPTIAHVQSILKPTLEITKNRHQPREPISSEQDSNTVVSRNRKENASTYCDVVISSKYTQLSLC